MQIQDNTILVTGGAGFIGSHLIEELLLHNPTKIIVLDNLVRGSLKNISHILSNPCIEFIEGDIRNVKLLEKCVQEAAYVFHMAALRINACAANPSEGFEVMIQATFQLINLCRLHKVKKIIYSSSASIYGLAENFPTPETENPYHNQTFYGGAKLWVEQLLRSYKFMYNLDYVTLRYFNVYGPRMDTEGQYTEVMIKWLTCINEDKPLLIYGDGLTTMDFVYVKDVAKANIAALISDVTDECFNIGTSRETSLQQLVKILLQINRADNMVEFRTADVINPVSRRWANIDKAKKTLGFTPIVSLENGLYELSQWYFNKRKNDK